MSLFLDSPDLLPKGDEKEQIAYLRDYLYKSADVINKMYDSNSDNITEAISGLDSTQIATLRSALNVYSKSEADERTVRADAVVGAGKTTIDGTEWSYRKWKNGFIEIWGKPSCTFVVSEGVTTGGLYRYDQAFLMTDLVSELYAVCAGSTVLSGSYGIVSGDIRYDQVAEVALYRAIALGSNVTATVTVYMTGKY